MLSGITPGHHCLLVTTPPLLQNLAAQDHVLKAALNTPALASPLLLVEKHEAERDWCWPCLCTATPFLQHSTVRHFCLGVSLHATHPMPHPKVPGLAGRWHRRWLPASGSCLWGHPCGGGMLSSFGKTTGEGNTGFGLGVTHNEG